MLLLSGGFIVEISALFQFLGYFFFELSMDAWMQALQKMNSEVKKKSYFKNKYYFFVLQKTIPKLSIKSPNKNLILVRENMSERLELLFF